MIEWDKYVCMKCSKSFKEIKGYMPSFYLVRCPWCGSTYVRKIKNISGNLL